MTANLIVKAIFDCGVEFGKGKIPQMTSERMEKMVEDYGKRIAKEQRNNCIQEFKKCDSRKYTRCNCDNLNCIRNAPEPEF